MGKRDGETRKRDLRNAFCRLLVPPMSLKDFLMDGDDEADLTGGGEAGAACSSLTASFPRPHESGSLLTDKSQSENTPNRLAEGLALLRGEWPGAPSWVPRSRFRHAASDLSEHFESAIKKENSRG